MKGSSKRFGRSPRVRTELAIFGGIGGQVYYDFFRSLVGPPLVVLSTVVLLAVVAQALLDLPGQRVAVGAILIGMAVFTGDALVKRKARYAQLPRAGGPGGPSPGGIREGGSVAASARRRRAVVGVRLRERQHSQIL